MEKKSKKPFIALLIVIIVIALVAAAHIINADDSIDTKPLPTVSVAHAYTGDIAVETSLVGTVEPGDIYYVLPKAAGEVLAVYVEAGDYVHAGDPIADIDNSKAVDAARISLDAATVSLDTARDSASLAQTNFERMSVLYAAGDISQASYESYKSSLDQAQAAVEGCELQLESAKLNYDTQLEYSTVTSPADGTVETTSMTEGALVSSASYIAVISADSERKLSFSVTSRLLELISVGDSVRISRGGEEYEGYITSKENIISATTGLYPVEARFEGSDSIPIGTRVKVYFDAERAFDTLLVDTDWLYYDGGQTYVYTVSYDEGDVNAYAGTISQDNLPGIIHKEAVETGLSDGGETQVISGIGTDDLIAATWTSQLYEGARVQVLPEVLP